MAQNKTAPTTASVDEFIDAVDRDVLRTLLGDAVGIMRERYECTF
jgi:hypothetical protein